MSVKSKENSIAVTAAHALLGVTINVPSKYWFLLPKASTHRH